MNAEFILTALTNLGVDVYETQGKLKFSPASVVSNKLLQLMKKHKAELLELAQTAILCPHCGCANLIEGATQGFWCNRCSQLAWRNTKTGIEKLTPDSIRLQRRAELKASLQELIAN